MPESPLARAARRRRWIRSRGAGPEAAARRPRGRARLPARPPRGPGPGRRGAGGRRAAPRGDRHLRARPGRAEGPRPAGRPGVRRREGRAARPDQGALRRRSRRPTPSRPRPRRRSTRCCAGCPTSPSRACPRAARTTTSCSSTSGEPREFDFEPLDHLELGQRLGAIDTERGAKVSGARFYFLTGVGAQLQLAMLNLAMAQALEAGFVPVVPPVLVKPEAMEGTGFLGAGRRERLPPARGGPLPRRHVGGAARRVPHGRGARRRPAAAAVRRLVDLLPQGGRVLRQGHPRHHPGAPVRQDRDVLLLPTRTTPPPSTSGCSAGRRRCSPRSSCPTGSSTSRPVTSAGRRRASSTARRGCRRRAATAS